jgi:hypothetical protein
MSAAAAAASGVVAVPALVSESLVAAASELDSGAAGSSVPVLQPTATAPISGRARARVIKVRMRSIGWSPSWLRRCFIGASIGESGQIITKEAPPASISD